MPAVAHECIIGEIIDYDATRLVTLSALKEHIKQQSAMAELMNEKKASFLLELLYGQMFTAYSLAEYCDGRRNTDLHRFNFCPECGQRINWRAIKEARS